MNIFDDEQGTGHFKATSENEDKQKESEKSLPNIKESEKSLPNIKESFESRRTTNNIGSKFDSEEPRVSKDVNTENTETRDDDK